MKYVNHWTKMIGLQSHMAISVILGLLLRYVKYLILTTLSASHFSCKLYSLNMFDLVDDNYFVTFLLPKTQSYSFNQSSSNALA